MNYNHQQTKDAIRLELEATRKVFHTLLDSLSENDLYRKSLNAGWTNAEILVHMTFGFIILNALLPLARLSGHLPAWTSKFFAWLLNAFTIPFNWINVLGTRGQAKLFTYKGIAKVYDLATYSLLRKIEHIQDDEWERGMYYPTRWDSNFSDFMTIRELFHYPVKHFNFHREQIARF